MKNKIIFIKEEHSLRTEKNIEIVSKFFKPKITIFFGFNTLNLKQPVARKPFSIRNMEQKEHKNKSEERSQKKLNTVRKS